MRQREDFDLQRQPGAGSGGRAGDHSNENGLHDGDRITVPAHALNVVRRASRCGLDRYECSRFCWDLATIGFSGPTGAGEVASRDLTPSSATL